LLKGIANDPLNVIVCQSSDRAQVGQVTIPTSLLYFTIDLNLRVQIDNP